MTKYFYKRAIALITMVIVIVPTFAQLAVSAEEIKKYPYMLFGRNGITMTVTSNLCINGNIHTNKEAEITSQNSNINGKITRALTLKKE